jgi:hypothetical protein
LVHPVLSLILALAPWAASGQEALDRLATWTTRARSVPRSVDGRRLEDLEELLAEVRPLREPASRVAGELARLAALVERVDGNAVVATAARLGREALEGRLDGLEGPHWSRELATNVLSAGADRPDEERRVAARLLAERRAPAALEPLLGTARRDDDPLAPLARELLEGWPDGRVHALFLDLAVNQPASSPQVGRHFEAARESLDEGVQEALLAELTRRYQSADWRDAARARDLVGALDTRDTVPILIGALATWDARTRAGEGSVRIRSEIHGELKRLSGRSIAPVADRWSRWWTAVQEGRVALPEDLIESGESPSRATFFGLRVETDRVLFVVDGSSSMQTRFGTAQRTRHEEAIEQLLSFLERSGEGTRFAVALFDDRGVSWRQKLTRADESGRAAVRRWLEGKRPEGRTLLFEGLRAGLDLDRRGRLNPERVEVDTVVVLCDGATTEGPGWVADWLAQENAVARLVFHCVQIGQDGNGTLEALSEGSGGSFLRVQG